METVLTELMLQAVAWEAPCLLAVLHFEEPEIDPEEQQQPGLNLLKSAQVAELTVWVLPAELVEREHLLQVHCLHKKLYLRVQS